MNVLSLFDGMSCGQLALRKAGIETTFYFASEIDKHAIRAANRYFPDTIRVKDVRELDIPGLNGWITKPIQLLIGGSPCQNFSFSGKRNGMTTKTNEEILTLDRYLELKNEGFEFSGQSYLFWEYVRVLRELQEVNPNVKFLLENVVMGKKWQDVITGVLGVEPILIDSALVSAQQRKRLYWTNIKDVNQPEDKNITLLDILDDENQTNPAAIPGRYINKATIVGRRINDEGHREDYNKKIPIVQCLEVRKTNRDKSNCITTVQKDNVLTNLPVGRHIDVYGRKLPYRNYTLTELCRLQTVPEDYFDLSITSQSQAMKMLGNGWTVDVITHILSYL
jgi:DNA (cytosine-5)-methyltransferase 3A